jgi:peroxiredoxin Q/BCP
VSSEESRSPAEGDTAPDFELETDDGARVRLGDLRGRAIVLFFYPKDGTPGCTLEACEFRDGFGRFEAEGALVFGVSPDSVSSHARFRSKHDLNFPLLADTDHEVAERYGVWKEKSMYGKKFWGVERSTFLIDEEGRIVRVWRRVRPRGHAEEVAQALSADGPRSS